MNFRFWTATALLAGSWMLGLYYFHPVDGWAWAAMVAAAVLLMGNRSQDRTDRRIETLALVIFLPAVWFAAWPFKAAPLLIVLGLGLRLMTTRSRWAEWLSGGAVAAGVVLFVQALVLSVYMSHTARSHDLPQPLPKVIAGAASLFGVDAAADGSSVVVHSMRQTHRLAATWEMLLDPVTLLFFVGALALLLIIKPRPLVAPKRGGGSSTATLAGSATDGRGFMDGWRTWIKQLRILTLIVLLWLPVRAGLLTALYLHRVLRTDTYQPLHAMNHFFAPWMLLVLLIVPVLLAWRFVRSVAQPPSAMVQTNDVMNKNNHSRGRLCYSAGLIALAVAIFTLAIYWDPPGTRKEGRVIVVERHSEWEPTTRAYDTEWFVEPRLFDEGSAYNYARIYRYLEQYYDVERLLEKDKIDDETLNGCDVLIIKTPTERYSPDEIKAVHRFVERGGGLLLVGEHTNFERSATVLNDIVRPMGFIFRDDLLNSFNDSPYDQTYYVPCVPHPVVQHLPTLDFAGSCSIDPGGSRGRPVIAPAGLWSMGPEYNHANYFPVPQHYPEMQYGPFVQAWSTRFGRGRVMAFTDSTIFSNFCVGQPGKSELMLGMVEWLNHTVPWLDPRPWLTLLGLIPLGIGLWMADFSGRRRLLLLAAGSFGWVVGSVAVVGLHAWAMPTPEKENPEPCVVVDRTTSNVPLGKGLYPKGEDRGYGMLEAWLSRLDCQAVRKSGAAACSGDLVVIICPSLSPPEEFSKALDKYVSDGGRLLVIDSPENSASKANTILRPFGLKFNQDRQWKGKLTTVLPLPEVEVDQAREVSGGHPLARLGKLTVAAAADYGRGSVTAVGFGSLWNDTRMGATWGEEPDATTKDRYKVLFGLLRPMIHGTEFPAEPTPKKAEPSILKESGPAEL